ncbi:unnamed protein product [Rhizophagus irregularis]|nr:unnamed protein product [Rhizophagus irregularis]
MMIFLKEEYGLFIHEVRLPTTLAYSEPQAYYFSDFFGGTAKHTTNGEEVVILFADTLCQVNCIIIE